MNPKVNSVVTSIALEMVGRSFKEVKLSYNGSGNSKDEFDVTVPSDHFLSRSDKISIKLDDLVGLMHGGYEEEYGGSGTISIKVQYGKAIVGWEHHDNYEDSISDDRAILDDSVRQDLVDIISKVAKSCAITYVGGGDSMDGYDLDFGDGDGNIVNVKDDEVLKALNEALDSLMVDGAVSGFWDNKGGHGHIYIDCENTENSYWDHYNYDIDSEVTNHNFKIVVGRRPAVLAKGVLCAAQRTNRYANFRSTNTNR